MGRPPGILRTTVTEVLPPAGYPGFKTKRGSMNVRRLYPSHNQRLVLFCIGRADHHLKKRNRPIPGVRLDRNLAIKLNRLRLAIHPHTGEHLDGFRVRANNNRRERGGHRGGGEVCFRLENQRVA